MDAIIQSVRAMRYLILLIAVTLALCGAVLLKAENTLAVQLLAGLALALSLPLAVIYYRLTRFMAADRKLVEMFATGGKVGKNMAHIRWGLIDAFNLFMYGEFEEAGKIMRKVSNQAYAVAHDCWWLDAHGTAENEA